MSESYQIRAATQAAITAVLDLIAAAAGYKASDVGGATLWYDYSVADSGAVERAVLNDVSSVSGVNATTEQQAVSWAADLASTASATALLGLYPALGSQLASLVSGISGLQATGSGDPFTSWAAQRRAGVARTVLKAGSSTDASAVNVQVTIGGYSKSTIQSIFAQQLALATSLARPTPAPGAAAQTTININALYDVARQAALIEAAGAFTAIPFSSRQEAYAARDLIADAIDAECNLISDSATRGAFASLRLKLIADAAARSAGLPQAKKITLPRSLPAVVLAARFYDDPGMALDLVQRNGIDNPLFVPGGVPLEVLSQ